MKNFFLLAIVFLLCASAAVYFSGFYPIARIEGRFIVFRTFAKAERAAQNFANAEFQKSGLKQIDFALPANSSLRRDIARGSFTFLIEDSIAEKEGGRLADDFGARVSSRVELALKKGNNLEAAARAVYGLSLEDFRIFVLEPQARRDIITEELKAENQVFFNWISEKKNNARVRLYFVDFRWTGEKVE